MLQTLLQTLVTTVGIATIASAAPTELPQTPIQVSQERFYMVKSGESLSQIAEREYNNIDAWTSIAKDNPQVTNPHVIEAGTILKIRMIPQATEQDVLPTPAVTAMHDSIVLEVSAAPTAQPTVSAAQTTAVAGPLTDEQLTYLGQCEAGMDPAKNTGNGYYGAFQFSYGTWKSMNTGYERADLAPIEVQKDAVQRLLSRSSIFTQFPGCARKMRALGMI